MKILFSLMIMLTGFVATAQPNDTGNWWLYFGNQTINQKWNWHNEVQYRNYNFAGDLQQLLVRTGIGYNLTENNNNILLGYGFVKSENYVGSTDMKISNNEHRIYQQFITKQKYGRIYTQHRYRVEERFLENDFRMRFRYFLSLNIPLNSKTMQPNTLYVSTYDEIFINGDRNLFDRNRLYGGIGYVINNNFKVETGFMAQTVETSNRNQFQVMLFNNLPLKRR